MPEQIDTIETNTCCAKNFSELGISERVEKSHHREKLGSKCLEMTKLLSSKGFLLAASSYPLSQHGAFKRGLSVGSVLSLIYSFKQWQTYLKTIEQELGLELTPIIMQFCKKKNSIVSFPPL